MMTEEEQQKPENLARAVRGLVTALREAMDEIARLKQKVAELGEAEGRRQLRREFRRKGGR